MRDLLCQDRLFSLSVKFIISIFYFIYFSFPLLLGWGGEEDPPTNIVYLSAVWFFGLLLLASISEKYFWMIAPIALLFTPNAVNNIFPGTIMGPAIDNPVFSFITHIDIYLAFGVFAFCDFKRKIKFNHIALIFFIVIGFLSSLLFSLVNDTVLKFWYGSFQVRYLVLLLLLFCYANPRKYEESFMLSLVIAALLIFFEAIVSSYFNGSSRLTSGNYGVNLLGHLFAAMSLFLFFWKRTAGMVWRFIVFLLLAVFLYAIILTGTRFSLLVLFGGFAIVLFAKKGGRFGKILGAIFLVAFFFLFLSFSTVGVSIYEGLSLAWQGFTSGEEVLVTSDSSSIVTRMVLWSSTWDMASDNWWLGVTPGEWAFLRESYGIPFETVLDPHNEVLNVVVNYGFVVGGFYLYVLYAAPIAKVIFSRIDPHPELPWFAMLAAFFVAGVSNSITWKHQLAFLVAYAALAIIFYQRNAVRESIDY